MGDFRKNDHGNSMKFLVDMPLSPNTVRFLKNLGYEAIRVSELGMSKSKDKDIFDYAGVIVIIEDTQIRIRNCQLEKINLNQDWETSP